MPRRRYPFQHKGPGFGLMNEQILRLVLERSNWNPYLICSCASVCRRMNELVKAEMWKGFCLSRAPRMSNDLLAGVKNDALEIGWDKLAKLMIYCPGCRASRHFECSSPTPGHMVHKSRFSQTAGKSFLHAKCRTDVLYVTDLCEHLDEAEGEDLGLFRGAIRSFKASKTWKMLIERGVELETDVSCPFCRSKVWSMTEAKMIPATAQKRLASYDDCVEIFVCINGHLHGMCSLLPLSDDEGVGLGPGSSGFGSGRLLEASESRSLDSAAEDMDFEEPQQQQQQHPRRDPVNDALEDMDCEQEQRQRALFSSGGEQQRERPSHLTENGMVVVSRSEKQGAKLKEEERKVAEQQAHRLFSELDSVKRKSRDLESDSVQEQRTESKRQQVYADD